MDALTSALPASIDPPRSAVHRGIAAREGLLNLLLIYRLTHPARQIGRAITVHPRRALGKIMSRPQIPYSVDDLSSLARTLRAQLLAREGVPGHVEFLNMLARAGGRRNFQALRAEAAGAAELASAPEASVPPVDIKTLDRVRRCFGPEGRLERWPSKRSDQVLALWALWSKLPSKVALTEQEISQRLKALHDFGDHALLRRELFNAGLVHRTSDCREYRRIEQAPTAEAAALIGMI